MKKIALFGLALATLSYALAANASPVSILVSLERPGSPMMRPPVSSRLEIFSNGDVLRTTTTGNPSGPAETHDKIIAKLRNLEDVKNCVAELESVTLDPKRTGCMDDPGSHYSAGNEKNRFGLRLCGQVQSVDSYCADRMISLLDALETIGRYQ